MGKLFRCFIPSILFLLNYPPDSVAAPVPSGTDRWVSVGGINVGDCSDRHSPCGSIQYAIKSSTDGDRIHVNVGNFTEDIDFLGKAVSIRSVSGPKSTAIHGSGSGSVVSFSSGEQPTSVLRGFTVTGGSSADGGGIYIHSSSPTISDCTVRGNSAHDDGGGIFIYRASPTIIDSTVSGNSASDNGGGIYSLTSSSTITGCTISRNSAGNEGGGVYASSGSSIVSGCTISGNSATGGSGLFLSSSSPTIANCIISGNSADYGGGIYSFHEASPTVVNCTISGNSSIKGGGIYVIDQSSPLVANSILWGNYPDMVALDHDSSITIEYSDTQSNTSGTGNIQADPLFVEPVSSLEAPTAEGDYHLQSGSPCIEAGTSDTTAYPFIPADDFDGDTRPQGWGVDMGADEYPGGKGLWYEAVSVGDGWHWLPWFGYFNLDFSPWVYHQELGFLYPFGETTTNVVLWSSAMDAFWWTSDIQYPYVYRFSDGEWLWYLEGSASPCFFVRLSDGVWERW